MTELALVLMVLAAGFAVGWAAQELRYARLRAKYANLTDRDERGRFVKRER